MDEWVDNGGHTRCSMIFKVDAPTIRNRVPHFDGDKIDGIVGGF